MLVAIGQISAISQRDAVALGGCSVPWGHMSGVGQGVMSGGSVPKDICFSRVANGIYPCSGVAGKNSLDIA